VCGCLAASRLDSTFKDGKAIFKSPNVFLGGDELVSEAAQIKHVALAGRPVSGADEYPAALVLIDQAIGRQGAQCPLKGHEGDAVLLGQFTAARQALPGFVLAAADRLAEVIGDL